MQLDQGKSFFSRVLPILLLYIILSHEEEQMSWAFENIRREDIGEAAEEEFGRLFRQFLVLL